MPNKRTDNNDRQTHNATLQQQNDEAFINELYDAVSQESQSQPSELLDQRIINAAHKAVNTSNKPKGNNKFKWYSSLATAASLTLVISLVVLQQSNILPNEQANNMLKQGVVLQKPMASTSDNESIADQEVVVEQIDYQAQVGYSAMPSQVENASATTTKMSNTIKIAAEEKMVRATQYEKKAQLIKPQTAERMMAASPMIMTRFNKIEQGKAQEDRAEIIDLSIEQLKQYKRSNKALDTQNKWLWSFSSENHIEYIIHIFNDNHAPLEYRLDKNTFKVMGLSKRDLEKSPLNNIPLSKIMILNTRN
ncbi:MAG: hypothetical protein QMC62_00455 [Alteromonadaceae bacterium]